MFWVWAVKIYLHAKFWASSLKIERIMLNFVLYIRFHIFWAQTVKIYLHATVWASSSKIERVMLNFVFFTFLAAGGQDILVCKISDF